MKIGIIGAGNIGSTLTRRFTALGHEVSVANSRDPETLADLRSGDRCHRGDSSQRSQGRRGGSDHHPGEENP